MTWSAFVSLYHGIQEQLHPLLFYVTITSLHFQNVLSFTGEHCIRHIRNEEHVHDCSPLRSQALFSSSLWWTASRHPLGS